jgi:hypothetical protein
MNQILTCVHMLKPIMWLPMANFENPIIIYLFIEWVGFK